jgi:DNA-binding transcriptional ArsR family regulator
MNLRKLLASSCRQRILKELSKHKDLNVMGLVRDINSNYNEVNRNLKILENEGIVASGRCGRLRLIKLNRENPRTLALLGALRILDSENGVFVTQ